MATSKTLTPIIDRAKFFSSIRATLFNGKINPSQVRGIDAILNEWERQRLTDLRWLSYMIGTVYHETGRTMQPVEEIGRGKGKDYGLKLKMGRGPGRRIPYTTPDHIYFGRGLVQITWYENYELMGRLLGIDLLNHPEKALEMDTSVRIMFEGMMRGSSSFGDFTGRCLEQYFYGTTADWVNARKIINSLDCAPLIASYSQTVYRAVA